MDNYHWRIQGKKRATPYFRNNINLGQNFPDMLLKNMPLIWFLPPAVIKKFLLKKILPTLKNSNSSSPGSQKIFETNPKLIKVGRPVCHHHSSKMFLTPIHITLLLFRSSGKLPLPHFQSWIRSYGC